VRPNDHYLVEGDDVTVVDWNGNEYQIPNRRSFALCGCGGSRSKPLFDGAPSRGGFQGAAAAFARPDGRAPPRGIPPQRNSVGHPQRSRVSDDCKEEPMDRFLIETPHREQDCLNLIEMFNAQGYLTHFDWGCMNGVHTGWALIEADSEAEARLAVPPLVR